MSHPVLIGGQWRAANASGTFQAVDPKTREPLPDQYPISTWADCDEALSAAAKAFVELTAAGSAPIAKFLDLYATKIEGRAAELVAAAHAETGLPVEPRLAKAELPRTVNQLRQAAEAVRDGSWVHATIDTKNNIRSMFSGAGPVAVFGPNNFPFAFNSIAGGDFVAAIASGCPVIAKGHSSHPTTTRIFGELAHEAATEAGLPVGTIQLVYRTGHADGEKLVSDHRISASGYTGARSAGLKLKAAADKAGKLFYAELSSVNPLVILPGALEERSAALVDEYGGSCLMGTGQFCTNPGMVLLLAGAATETYIGKVVEKFNGSPAGVLLSGGTLDSLHKAVETLEAAGAELLTGGDPISGA
ncbi:MAG TPA: aldehyde dehydrogenase family protein, partial [Pirellulales bacterium]